MASARTLDELIAKAKRARLPERVIGPSGHPIVIESLRHARDARLAREAQSAFEAETRSARSQWGA